MLNEWYDGVEIMAEMKIKIDFDEQKFYEMIEKFKQENPDFVEVVRCKDCKHYDRTSMFDCEYMNRFIDGDDYCSHGEKLLGGERIMYFCSSHEKCCPYATTRGYCQLTVCINR